MNREQIQDVLRVAKSAALTGAEVVREVRRNGSAVRHKGVRDLVTEADVQAERAILEIIRSAFPDHGVLAEESAPELLLDGLREGPLWIIDPVDGTTNFAHGHPQVGVSVAFVEDGVPLAGVVAAPFQDELFEAARGFGALLNGEPIRPSTAAQPVEALGRADRQAGVRILLAERQFEPEQCSLPGPAMQADLPVHGFDQTLGDGQTEAAATETAGSRTVGLDEGAK